MMQLKYVLPLSCEVWQAYLEKKKMGQAATG